MKFNLIDKITSLSAERIVAVKHVSLAEEYLADHFPTFPVLPGVMMLEAIVQAAGWLLHHRRKFSCSMAVLKEARNVKYGHFVPPGAKLAVEVDWTMDTPGGAVFKAVGNVTMPDGATSQAVSARVEIAYMNLGLPQVDARLVEHSRRRMGLIWEEGDRPRTELS